MSSPPSSLPPQEPAKQVTPALFPTPLAKGCGVASVGLIFLWMIPFVMVFSIMAAFFGGPPLGLIFFPLFIGGFIYAAVKILKSGQAQSPAPQERVLLPKRPLTFAEKQAELFRTLPEGGQAQHRQLMAKCSKLRELASHIDDPKTQAEFGPGLEKLQWLHLKSLLAREHLRLHTSEGMSEGLVRKLQELQEELGTEPLSAQARASKLSTVEMTEERLRNYETRQLRLTEIESDLERIESQLDLSVERAAIAHQLPARHAALQAAC